jgi:PHP family Zn ribbon phosphoesterase
MRQPLNPYDEKPFNPRDKVHVACKKCKAVFLWDPDDKFNRNAKCPTCGTPNK